jgi:hypothetical protein
MKIARSARRCAATTAATSDVSSPSVAGKSRRSGYRTHFRRCGKANVRDSSAFQKSFDRYGLPETTGRRGHEQRPVREGAFDRFRDALASDRLELSVIGG